MKKLNRLIALLMALTLLLGVIAATLTACGNGEDDPPEQPEPPEGPANPPENSSYSVSIKTYGGMAMEGIQVWFYADEAMTDLENVAETGADGIATVSMPRQDKYYAKLAKLPAGYNAKASYEIKNLSTSISLTSSVITDNTDITTVSYQLGEVIRDFTVTTLDGETFKLSEVLKEKEMVLINFWYVGCSNCWLEFPHMQTVYEEYKDDVAIIALNNYGDTEAQMRAALNNEEYTGGVEYTFDFAAGGNDIALAIERGIGSWGGWPTSIVVDRYGVITLVEVGALTAEKYFRTLFDFFTDVEYKQTLLTEGIGQLFPKKTPTAEMPSSDEIAGVVNKGNIDITYSGEKDEYSWPFVIDELLGVDCIATSNAFEDSSYATLIMNLSLNKNDVFYFDYFSSTEKGGDIVYLIVDGEDICAISGLSEDWERCFGFVADQTKEYEIALIYLKDFDTDSGDDTFYVKEIGITDIDSVDKASYIPRLCSSEPNKYGEYQSFSDVVLGDDGYYHVCLEHSEDSDHTCQKNGPIVLADLMGYTNFSDEESVYTLLYKCTQEVTPLTPYYEELVTFCNYASNGKISGLCPVTERLRELLEIVVNTQYGTDADENMWLTFCQYYEAYGTDGEQFEDPIKGLAPFSAFDTVLNTDSDPDDYFPNSVTYDRVIMPRGLWYAFTPEISGAYRITSNSTDEVDAWIFLEDRSEYCSYLRDERIPLTNVNNVSLVAYLEAGETYYIDIAYYDVYNFNSFTFKVEFIGESAEVFTQVSPGAPFTTVLDKDGNMAEIIAGGYEVKLCDKSECSECEECAEIAGKPEETKYYHVVLPDGTLGSVVYADFTLITSCMSYPVYVDNNINDGVLDEDKVNTFDLIELYAFHFGMTVEESYDYACYKTMSEADLKKMWGAEYADKLALYSNPNYKGSVKGGVDNTADVLSYVEIMYSSENSSDSDRYGCVAVDAELADILQKLMDKYVFENVENSWVKMAYFYKVYAANN